MDAPRHALLLALFLPLAGCIGDIRETTTPRTATEILLVSTAAGRAVRGFDPTPLAGKRVFIDGAFFDSVDKNFVMSALRDHLARNQVRLVDAVAAAEGNPNTGADLVLELRNGTLGIWDGDFVLGIPQLPVSAQGFPPVLLPPLYLFRRDSAQGWAKFQLWVYDPRTRQHVLRSPDLWGSSYYNQWWVLGIGPFDGSNDIWPDIDMERWATARDETDSELRQQRAESRGWWQQHR